MNQSERKTHVQSEPVRPVHWLTLMTLLAASIAVRLWCLACKPFWFDECFSVEAARIDWRNFLHLLWWREANMSLYYVLLRMWLGLGQSPFFIRSLSVVIGAATLPAIYWLARSLYDRRVALISVALFSFNAYHIRYAQEARSYTLFVLLATLSSSFLVTGLRQPGRRGIWLGYALISILAVYAHLYALLLIVAHWLAARQLGAPGFGRENRDTALSSELRRAWMVIGVAVLPLLVFVAKTGAGPIRWIQRPGLRDVIDLYEHLAGGNSWLLLVISAAACVAAIAPSGKGLLAREQRWETWRCQFLLLWLLFPVVLTVLLSFARPVFLGRYMSFCLPALLVMVAAGLARLRQTWVLAAALSVILLLASQGISFVYSHDFDNERDASGEASHFILDHSQPGDVIVFHIAETRVPYEFFRSLRARQDSASPKFTAQLGPEILFPNHGPGLDYRDFTGKPTADFLHTLAPGHSRVWIMLMNNSRDGKPDATTIMLSQVLPQSFPKMMQWQFAKVEVRLYSKQ